MDEMSGTDLECGLLKPANQMHHATVGDGLFSDTRK